LEQGKTLEHINLSKKKGKFFKGLRNKNAICYHNNDGFAMGKNGVQTRTTGVKKKKELPSSNKGQGPFFSWSEEKHASL